jgi:hypothetical protein
MRPQLKPALRRVWRDEHTVQFGLDPAQALVLGDVDRASARFVASLDGSRDLPAAIAVGERLGLARPHARRLLSLLAGAGVLDDAATDTKPMLRWHPDDRERLRPDLASCSLARRSPDGGLGSLARRRAALVQVHGAGRVGASVASLLAAAGVGQVVVEDAGKVRPADVCPAGHSAPQVGSRREDAARRALRRAAPRTRVTRPPGRAAPDLVILTPVHGPPPARLRSQLVADRVPHLFAGVREYVGTIGPLVVPGRTSCLRCHDLIRRDRDPTWPAVAAQLASESPDALTPCDTALATAVAAHATLHALSFLEGDDPPSVNATIDVRAPHGTVRRRPWSAHPGCGCGWQRAQASDGTSPAVAAAATPTPRAEVTALSARTR